MDARARARHAVVVLVIVAATGCGSRGEFASVEVVNDNAVVAPSGSTRVLVQTHDTERLALIEDDAGALWLLGTNGGPLAVRRGSTATGLVRPNGSDHALVFAAVGDLAREARLVDAAGVPVGGEIIRGEAAWLATVPLRSADRGVAVELRGVRLHELAETSKRAGEGWSPYVPVATAAPR